MTLMTKKNKAVASALPDYGQFSNYRGIMKAIRRAQRNLVPPPTMKVSEWAEANVKIPVGNAVPGPYRIHNAPYQREPMDMLTTPGCYRVTLMWGAQIGKTLLALLIQGYCIGASPRSQMMMQPSENDLGVWKETKFNPLAEDCDQVALALASGSVNNKQMRSYPGGFLMYAWAGSPKTMRGRSAPTIVCDEVDGYERTPEGHPVSLLWQRSATFGDQRFLVDISTPTIRGESYIEKSFLAGDQRYFYVVCPHCKEHVTLQWEMVRWPGQRENDDENMKYVAEMDADGAHIHCSACGAEWSDGQRVAAIRTAEAQGAGWKASKAFNGHASYHCSELYSVFRKISAIVRDYFDKLKTDDLQTFYNVSLSLTWDEQGERADPDSLMGRREEYAADVPMNGVYLTAGIDMQLDRLECEVVAWGIGEESWSVGYYVLYGDPLTPEPWDQLDDLLESEFVHETGAIMKIMGACLDTGGTNGMTAAAYAYAKGRTGKRLFAIKGGQGFSLPIVTTPQRKQSGRDKRKVDLYVLGVDQAKLVVVRRWNKADPGPGYCHFPNDREQDWFEQITAEKLVTRYVKGHPVREWKKPDRARNEGLDCRVYAYAALKITAPRLLMLARKLGLDTSEAIPEQRTRLKSIPRNRILLPETAETVTKQPESETKQARIAPQRARGEAARQNANPHSDNDAPAPQNVQVVRSKSAAKIAKKATPGRAKNWVKSW